MCQTKVLVAGATGINGRELVSQLAAAGVHVRALVRNSRRAASIANEFVHLVEGDLSDKASLGPAFEGIENAYIVTAIHPDAITLFSNFYDAAKLADVRHVIKFSGLGADPNSQSEILRQHGESDELLVKSGLDYTIIRTNSFYQNILWQTKQIRLKARFCLPLGGARQSLVDVRDIAEATVNVLLHGGYRSGIYHLTGPEALSFFDVAMQISEAVGYPIEYVPISSQQAEKSMRAAGIPEWNARALVEIQRIFATGAYVGTTDDLRTILGREPRHFSEFAADHVRQFKTSGTKSKDSVRGA